MNLRDRNRNSLKEIIKKQESFNTPNKVDSISNLQKLREAVIEMTKLVGNNGLKPFSPKYIKLLNDNLYCETFRNAFVGVVYDRIKNILNDTNFSNKFEISVTNYSITIYVNCGIKLVALDLNILDNPIKLSSIIYDLNYLISKKDEIDSELIELSDKKTKLTNDLVQENNCFEEMLNDPHNFVPVYEEKYTYSIFEPEQTGVTPISKQQFIVDKIKKELSLIDEKTTNINDKREKIIEIINSLEQIDLDEFIKLRKLVEDTLGIKATKKDYVPIIRSLETALSSEIYMIGATGYKLEYTKKRKVPINSF